MRTNPERSQKSRDDIIAAARTLFGTKGYGATSTPMIAAKAGVSRGAMYHHYESKEAVFRAVAEAEFSGVSAAIDSGANDAADPLEMLIEGGEHFITAMSDPISRQILLVDAPAILGAEAVLRMDATSTTRSLRDGIVHAQNEGRLSRDIPTDALTSMMSGAYDRAVLDGFGTDAEGKLAIRHALRSIWFGLSRIT